jgi:ABC-type multidrug transport system ATPase subunit
MLRRLKEAGITILVSTPYMDEAGMCDRVALMQGGRIMTISPPREVIGAYPLSLLSVRAGNTYRLISDLRAFPGIKGAFAFGQTVHVSYLENDLDPALLTHYLRQSGHDEVEIQTISPTIEDCFMELMLTAGISNLPPEEVPAYRN